VAAIAAAAILAPTQGRAEGLFDFLFGSNAPWAAPPPREAPRWRDRPPEARAGVRSANPGSSGAGDGFCVRTCDGYFFPLIKSSNATRQQSCEYACPSAPMAIYHGSSIEGARNHKGDRYTVLPTAFSFRDKATKQCACNEPQSSQDFFVRISRSDPTLRSGDILVEGNGAVAYRGSDFVPLDRASFVPSQIRERLRAILERASDRRGRADVGEKDTLAPQAPTSDIPKSEPAPAGTAPLAAPQVGADVGQ
jgi:hypothetical protein